MHDNFSSHLLHDIAIVQLYIPILYTNYSRPICLPEVNSSLPEHNCWISGWGYSKTVNEISATLLMTSASLWKGNIDSSFPYYEEYEFLSGSSNGSGHKGDSGGPFFCRNNNIYTLYGLASFNPPFAAPGTLISYVRVSSYVNWIIDSMKNAIL
ncbi:Plasma kallikrein [Trichinella spiralis]|uniref:Plasma kallikrein n=1 Tax=Trichinella spiralis TaxID=6334 RepID=A0ABR3K6J5_TRISP